MWNKMTLPKMCLFSVFQRDMQQCPKKAEQSHYMRIKLTFTKNLPLSVFKNGKDDA